MLGRRVKAFCSAAALAAAAASGQETSIDPPPAAPEASVVPGVEPDPTPSVVPPIGSDQGTEDPGKPAGARPPVAAGGTGGASKPPAPPASPWKPLFFENDFSAYVDREPYVIGEELKRMPALDLPGEGLDFDLSVGGQLRFRYESHDDQIRPGGFRRNTFELWRWRQYYDLRSDNVRFYVETIDASSFGEELAPLPPDVNRFDLLNAFVDLDLYDVEDFGAGTLRYGRQELFYGKQRTISPADWTSTRRNFEGFKYLHTGEGWKFDAWALNPVNSLARGGIDAARFDTAPDEADRRRTFYGGYLSFTENKRASVDLYMLYQDDERPRPNFAEGDRGMNAVRLYGAVPTDASEAFVWDYDAEGGYEWGSDFGRRVAAGFATADLGHTWKKAAWKPRLGGTAWYGSGGGPTGPSSNETFYNWYPLGHAYWDQNDNLSGQNLVDVGVVGSIDPTAKLNFAAAHHGFWKADGDDFLYNVAQVPTGTADEGVSIGQESSVIATYTFNPNLSVQAGYARFWYGEVGRNITGRDDADFFYAMTTFNY